MSEMRNPPLPPGPADEQREPRPRRAFPFIILSLLLILFVVFDLGAISLNRLRRHVEGLENELVQLQGALHTAEEEAARLQDELAAAQAKAEERPPLGADAIVRAIAHRGFSAEAPENTLSAFALAREKGFAYVETDIHFTADGRAVCLHDDTIDRTSNGTGAIYEMSFDEVRSYDFGSWMSERYAGEKIPSLEEFLTLCRSLSLRPYLELKAINQYTSDQLRGLVETVKAYGMEDDVTWISFSYAYLNSIKAFDPNARLGYLLSSDSRDAVVQASWLKSGTNSVFVDSPVCSDELCSLCAEYGLPLEVWTLDEPEKILSLNPYISGVTSNSLVAGELLYDEAVGRFGP